MLLCVSRGEPPREEDGEMKGMTQEVRNELEALRESVLQLGIRVARLEDTVVKK